MGKNGIAVINKVSEGYSLEAVDINFDFSKRGVFPTIKEALRTYADEMSRGFSLSLGIDVTEADRSAYRGFVNNLRPAY